MDAPTVPSPRIGQTLRATWLGRIPYRAAWDLQKRLVAARVAGRVPDTLLLLEHDSVLTLGRGADPTHVLASPAELARQGIELIGVERGGEVTWHGPGQLVAYPILRLADRGLLVRPFVRALEGALVATCAAFGVPASRRDGHPGCWCDDEGPSPRKIGALGLRIERGVSYHGIALNVAPDLRSFELIDPCGMPGVASTSIAAERGTAGNLAGTAGDLAGTADDLAGTAGVERAATVFARALAREFGADLAWLGADALERGPDALPAPPAARDAAADSPAQPASPVVARR